MEAVAGGRKPAALIDVVLWCEDHKGEPATVHRAWQLGLVVWRNFEGHVADGILFNYAIAVDSAALACLLRAFTMRLSIVERQIRMGRALGYTWDDINAFMMHAHGGYPRIAHRCALALRGLQYERRWRQHTGVSLNGWHPVMHGAIAR